MKKKPAVVASSVQPVSDGWHVVALRLDQKGFKITPKKSMLKKKNMSPLSPLSHIESSEISTLSCTSAPCAACNHSLTLAHNDNASL